MDGDTLHFENLDERICLKGVDAPESRQKCKDGNGELYPCGQVATDALRDKIENLPVRCEGEERGRYGRLIVICYSADGTDLNGWLIRQGYALAYRGFSQRYIAAEYEAQKSKRGLWRGQFIKPWRWRRGDRLE